MNQQRTRTHPSIIRQIIELEKKETPELRKIYNDIMPQNCLTNATADFLRPRIAYRLQELSIGSLSEKAKTTLLKISKGNSNYSLGKNDFQMMPGTKIYREWKGINHEVEVLKEGFSFNGQKFNSLSSIATRITGTKWNGLKFFKLKVN